MCSKQVTEGRIKAFITYVQADIEHIHFVPGEQWWPLDEPVKLSKRLANTLTVLEQIGVSEIEMEAALASVGKLHCQNIFLNYVLGNILDNQQSELGKAFGGHPSLTSITLCIGDENIY